ncbi:hypothetical protein [Paenibacillus amylolyticus]|uniref:hypothetical protein n=1 Tax=Paenibacillus amylolyticus TaxID=1451 RepID=UPI0033987674
MITPESVFFELSDEQLRSAFQEYDLWRSSGMLQNGILSGVHEMLEKRNNTGYTLNSLSEPLMFVFIKRFCNHGVC